MSVKKSLVGGRLKGSFDVVCFGRIAEDTFLGGDIFTPICAHGSCYEHIALGSKQAVESLESSFGGNALNAATTFARQGFIASMCIEIGDEATSRMALEEIGKEGIDLGLIYQQKGFRIPRSINIVAPNGERAILAHRGSPVETDLLLATLGGVDSIWAYISSLNDQKLLAAVSNWAKEAGVRVAFNPGSTELENPRQTIHLLGEVEVLILNKEEAQRFLKDLHFLTQKTNPKLNADSSQPSSKNTSKDLARLGAAELAELGLEFANICVVTDGPKGSWAAQRDGQRIHMGIHDDVKVVDRTGAGDAFASGFVCGLINNLSLEEALEFGATNATSVVSHVGSRVGILRA